MRRITALSAAAVAGGLGLGALAFGATGLQTLDVRLERSRAGTQARPRSVGRLTVVTGTRLGPGEAPQAARRVVIHFDKGLVFDPRRFPQCRPSVVARDDARCPAGSRVGGGSARAAIFVRGRAVANVTPAVRAFNGPPGASGPRIFLLVVASAGVRGVMTATLERDTGRYGRRLDVAIPPALRSGGVPGATVVLRRLEVGVGGVRNGAPLVALRGCSGGRLRFRADFTLTDGRRRTATSTAPCRR